MKLATESAVESLEEQVVETNEVEMDIVALYNNAILAQKSFSVEALEEANADLQADMIDMSIENLMHVKTIADAGQLNNSLVQFLKLGGDFESFIGAELPSINAENREQVCMELSEAIGFALEKWDDTAEDLIYRRSTGRKAPKSVVANAAKRGEGHHLANKVGRFFGKDAKKRFLQGSKPIKNAKGVRRLWERARDWLSKNYKTVSELVSKNRTAALIVIGSTLAVAATIVLIRAFSQSMAKSITFLKKAAPGLRDLNDVALKDVKVTKTIAKNLPKASDFGKILPGMVQVSKVIDALMGEPKVLKLSDVQRLATGIGCKLNDQKDVVDNASAVSMSAGTLGASGWNKASINRAVEGVISIGEIVARFKTGAQIAKTIERNASKIEKLSDDQVASGGVDAVMAHAAFRSLLNLYMTKANQLATGVTALVKTAATTMRG